MADLYDVVIVGAGISGSIVAQQAAEAGLRVLVLEAGTDLAWTYRGYQAQLQTFYDALYKTPEAPWAFNPNAPEPDIPTVPTPGAKYFVENGPQLYGSTYARALGGTTLHWMGTCLRMLPEDFDFHTRFGTGETGRSATPNWRPTTSSQSGRSACRRTCRIRRTSGSRSETATTTRCSGSRQATPTSSWLLPWTG